MESLTYLHHPSKHGGVIYGAAIPSPLPELVLAFLDARLCPLANVNHMILVQLAQLPLPLRQAVQLAAERLGANNIHLRPLNWVHCQRPKCGFKKSMFIRRMDINLQRECWNCLVEWCLFTLQNDLSICLNTFFFAFLSKIRFTLRTIPGSVNWLELNYRGGKTIRFKKTFFFVFVWNHLLWIIFFTLWNTYFSRHTVPINDRYCGLKIAVDNCFASDRSRVFASSFIWDK